MSRGTSVRTRQDLALAHRIKDLSKAGLRTAASKPGFLAKIYTYYESHINVLRMSPGRPVPGRDRAAHGLQRHRRGACFATSSTVARILTRERCLPPVPQTHLRRGLDNRRAAARRAPFLGARGRPGDFRVYHIWDRLGPARERFFEGPVMVEFTASAGPLRSPLANAAEMAGASTRSDDGPVSDGPGPQTDPTGRENRAASVRSSPTPSTRVAHSPWSPGGCPSSPGRR